MSSFLPTYVAFADELEQGTPPADATAWAADGQRMRIIADSLDLSSFMVEPIEDERTQTNILSYDDTIAGIQGGNEFPFETYMTGAEAVAAAGGQAASTIFSDHLAHCMGGVVRGYADTAAVAGAHSTTAVQVTTVANYAIGHWVGLVDADGMTHLRQIAGIAGDVLTLDRALPFTPADGDEVKACIVIHEDETVLEDSSVGPTTRSWLLQKGKGGVVPFEARGCVSSISGITLARNAVAKLAYTTMVGSWISPEAAPVPTWASAQGGAAGLSLGPRTKVAINNIGVSTNTNVGCSEFTVTPGIVRTRVESVTSESDGMPGTASYSLARNPCEVVATLTGHSAQHWTDFRNGQRKNIVFERLAPAGKAWAVAFRNCSIKQDPGVVPVNDRIGNQVTYRAQGEPDAATPLLQSRMLLVLC